MKTKLSIFALATLVSFIAIPFVFESSIFFGTIYSIFAVMGSFAVGAKLVGGKPNANN